MNIIGSLFFVGAFRFEGVGRPWLWIVLILAGAAVLYAGYRGAFDRVGRRLAWGMLLLRVVALLAITAALARPSWTFESETVDPGRLAVVLDDSASMSLADPSGPSRYVLARGAIDRLSAAIEADRSGPRTEVDLFGINGEPLVGKGPERPTVGRTDLARGVLGATARLRSRPLAAVVLLSDGMDNTGRTDLRELAESPAPIFAVGFKPDRQAGGLDLAARSVRAPERAMVHNEVKVEVTVAKTGGPATRATVAVRRGRETFASREVDFPSGDSEQVVGLPFTPGQAGRFVFSASVSADVGERRTANNVALFPLRVDAEPIRVVYLEGFLRYEYKYLKARLEDDPDVALISVVRKANAERPEVKSAADLLTADRLKNIDVVILGDMEAAYMSLPEYQTLLKWLDEKNHALLAIGGYHSFGPDGFRSTPMADALPVVFAEKPPYQTEEPFAMELTEEGRRHPIFEVSGDRARDASLWSGAPPLTGASLVRRAKPGAVVLAVNPSLLVEGEPAVVAAVQRFGGGRTMALTADATWRWSRFARVSGRSDVLHSRFWSQTLRWLAGRGNDDARAILTVAADRPSYEVGKPVTVRAARRPPPGTDAAGAESSSAEVGVEVSGPDGRSLSLPMRASTAEPDVFTGTYYPTLAGRYELAATLSASGKPIANQAAEFLVNGPDLELADPGTNRAPLQAVAATTGGVYVDVEDAQTLADKIVRKERRTRLSRSVEFWESSRATESLFLVFIAALTAEWLLRRRVHLV